MILTDEFKILNDKIKANQAEYREAAKIYALSSDELEKYEYLTGKDLRYKPGVVEKDKFVYSPLAKVFNKGLEKDDKKGGPLKRLKNIEDKNKEQLDAIEYQIKRQLDMVNKQGEKTARIN